MGNNIFTTINMPVQITTESIKDLLCSAIEGGSNYWIETLTRSKDITKAQAEYRQDVPFAGGHLVLLDDQGIKHTINIDSIKKGLKAFQEKYPRNFKDFVEDNADAETGDIFLQCCTYGEAIYG